MLISDLEKLEEGMQKKLVKIVQNYQEVILALREKGYTLSQIHEGLQKQNIFPPKLTYHRLRHIIYTEYKDWDWGTKKKTLSEKTNT